ncbi:GNAT family N-acetyltransferase [Kribbella antibiotica]|uniref:GNAT family N-acetyltransferase n=1 Tax=Kribbella antibiotica TaxID=190195 RepID=A0A4R4YPM0_9ACTN|nr:GNAT family N-acetyltransferase [Kribbella antibiotica]TDD47118.1 GNAT family N-acetyltransferase [Kribbella antibiotica]
MQEIHTTADLITAAAGDPLIVWAGQGFAPGIRAWYDGSAVAVASPELFQRNRLVVAGPPEGVARLVTTVTADIGTAYRPLGDEDLIRELANRVPGLEFSASFGWMDTAEIPPVTTTAAWLDGADGVEELLTEASPSSFAWPGNPAVRRWAAIRDEAGQLVSIAAEAWSAPEVGFIAGVTTRPVARGKGLSREVCGFVTAELVKRHGQAGLMVDRDNVAAIAVYHRLGYTYRRVATAGY